jgi:hypothetical protein
LFEVVLGVAEFLGIGLGVVQELGCLWGQVLWDKLQTIEPVVAWLIWLPDVLVCDSFAPGWKWVSPNLLEVLQFVDKSLYVSRCDWWPFLECNEIIFDIGELRLLALHGLDNLNNGSIPEFDFWVWVSIEGTVLLVILSQVKLPGHIAATMDSWVGNVDDITECSREFLVVSFDIVSDSDKTIMDMLVGVLDVELLVFVVNLLLPGASSSDLYGGFPCTVKGMVEKMMPAGCEGVSEPVDVNNTFFNLTSVVFVLLHGTGTICKSISGFYDLSLGSVITEHGQDRFCLADSSVGLFLHESNGFFMLRDAISSFIQMLKHFLNK